MKKPDKQETNNQESRIEDLTVNDDQTAEVKGGATIRVHYNTGWGNRIAI